MKNYDATSKSKSTWLAEYVSGIILSVVGATTTGNVQADLVGGGIGTLGLILALVGIGNFSHYIYQQSRPNKGKGVFSAIGVFISGLVVYGVINQIILSMLVV